MRVSGSYITIGKLVFGFLHEAEATADWEQLTNNCTIQMPANLSLDRNRLRNLVSPGDRVMVRAGYDGILHDIFKGYVAGISPKVPIEFRCEDEMYRLKQSTINDHINGCTVSALLKKHFNDIATDAVDAELGSFRIENLNRAKILEKLKEIGLHSFFRQEVLVIGKPYDPAFARKVTFHLSGEQRNIIEESLEYRRAKDVKLMVTAISLYPDGKRKEVKVGDQGGETRTLNYYNLSVEELTKAAHRDYSRLIYDGYRGSFTAFLEPYVRQGDIVVLKSPEESDRAGAFWVDKVVYKCNTDGFRQEIKLGPKA
jgi:hypothetical protein